MEELLKLIGQLNWSELSEDEKSKFIKKLESQMKLTVRTEKEESDFRKNLRDQIDGEIRKEIYDSLDKDLNEITGMSKKAGEKTYDFLKRASKELKDQVKNATQKLKDLEASDGDHQKVVDRLNGEITNLKNSLKKVNEEKEGLETKYKQESFESRVKGEIESALSDLKTKFKKYDTEIEQQRIIDATLSGFRAKYKPDEMNGSIVWADANGKPINDEKSGNSLGVKALLEKEFSFMVDPKRKAAGTGTGSPGAGSGGGAEDPEKAKFKLSDDEKTGIKSKVELRNFLQNEKKIDPIKNQEDFAKYFDANKEGLPLHTN